MNSAFPVSSGQSLRIALLGYRSHPFVGGQGIYLKYLSRALTQKGHQVDVISGPPYPQLDPSVRLIKIPSLNLYEADNHLTALRLRHLKSLSDTFEWWSMATGGFAEPYTFGRRVVQHLKHHGRHYHVVHDNQSLCWGLLKLQRLGFPVVTTIHHPITRDRAAAVAEASSWEYRLLARRWYSFLSMQRKVAQQLQRVVTVSEFARQDIAREFNRSDEGIEVVHNGIDTDIFRPLEHVDRVPERILTTTSSDQAIKGFAVLLHALKAVRAVRPGAHLVVIGKLNPEGSCYKLMHQLELDRAVVFKSGISDEELVTEYARASVVVCPSLYEGFGLPAAEALSCGAPLVSSDGGALPEIVGDAGVIVPAGNSDALGEALLKVLNTASLRAQLARAGRARVLAHFSWAKVADEMTRVYRQLIPAQPYGNR